MDMFVEFIDQELPKKTHFAPDSTWVLQSASVLLSCSKKHVASTALQKCEQESVGLKV